MHERLAATNPDEQNKSPRAFWGRTDSSGAQWKAGPANGRGGTAPGAARGIRAGSRALPVLGGGVRRAGSLLGGLRANGARVRRNETGPTNYRSDRYRLHGRRDRAGGRGAPGAESPPSRSSRGRATSPPPHASRGSPSGGRCVRASGAGGASRPARRRPQPRGGAPLRPPGRGAGAPSRRRGAGRPREPLPVPPSSLSRRRGRSRPLVLTGFCFPPGLTGPGSGSRRRSRLARGPALVTAAARSRRRDPRRGGRRASSSRRGRDRNFA